MGVDGAEWSVIDPMIEEGKLPNFKKLRDSGKSGTLITDYSNFSPSIWTSIATGKLPAKHGITNFLLHSPNSYYEIPVTSHDRKSAALWNILSHMERTVSVIAWWASWPAEKVKGSIISQRFFLSGFGVGPIGTDAGIGVGGENALYREEGKFLTWPEDLSVRLMNALSGTVEADADATPLGAFLANLKAEKHSPEIEHDLAVLENIFHTDLLVKKAATYLDEKEGPYDLSAIYLEGVDVTCHLFWKYLFPEPWREESESNAPPPEDLNRYESLIPLYYQEADRMIGNLLDKAGPKVLVMVISDHGFTSYLNPYDYNYPANTLLEKLDVLSRKDERIDFGLTRFFDYGSTPWKPVREVYLNLEGKYPEGIVSPDEAPGHIFRLTKALESLETVSGQKFVHNVVPLEHDAGVVIAFNNRLDRTEAVLIDGTPVALPEIFPPRTVSGNHRPQGIVCFYGAGVKPGRLLEPISSLDIAPTVLTILGIPTARDMDGIPYLPIIDELNKKATFEPSYDFLVHEKEQTDSYVDDALEERLRALGYIQ